MRRLTLAAFALAACAAAQQPQPPAVDGGTSVRGNLPPSAPPFRIETIGHFDAPFAMAFLPDGSLLVTEKAGKLKWRRKDGQVFEVPGVPAVAAGGQGGLLDVALAPDYAKSWNIYLTYSEGPNSAHSQLVLARAYLAAEVITCEPAQRSTPCPPPIHHYLDKVQVLWRSGSAGRGGQYGATIAFAPDGQSLYLSSGERQRFTPAQDPDQALGKIVRLTLDGKPWPGNPLAGRLGTPTVAVTDPPADTAAAVRAPVRRVDVDGPNLAPAATWSTGHRNPYGLAFDGAGRLWEVEMGPKGGDEVNLILPGRNYGWPKVSNGSNYDGLDIPDHRPGDGFEAPRLWWNPSISPGGMIVYSGALWPQWRGDLFVAALSGQALIRVHLTGDRAGPGDQWDLKTRIRGLAQAPDGAIWLLEDGGRGAGGALMRLTPAGAAVHVGQTGRTGG